MWPALPAGVRFDPLDLKLLSFQNKKKYLDFLQHLQGKSSVPNWNSHALNVNDEFIPSVEEMEGGVCYTHPRNLPSLQSYFFFDTSHLDSQVSLEWPTLPAGVRFRTPSTFTRKIQPAKF